MDIYGYIWIYVHVWMDGWIDVYIDVWIYGCIIYFPMRPITYKIKSV